MRLTWHEGIDSFLQETLVHLEQDEAKNNLLLGIALAVERNPSLFQEVVLVTVGDGENLLLAGLMTVPANLILYAVSDAPAEEGLFCLAQGMWERRVQLPGVVGPKEIAERFSSLWSDLNCCRAELDMPMRVYELREVNRDVIGEGLLRTAQEADLDWVIRAMASFEEDSGLSNAPEPERITRLARRLVARQSLYLWEHDGRVVSMAAKVRPTRHGISVNHVYTPRELRRRGYGTSCVAALSQLLLDSGYEFCTLFADLNNPTSNSIYRRIGYKPIGDFSGYRFTGGTP
ncbi:MAG: GNAT family N-acetyltransferase [Firmicutes bacterium]|nr:GNAT family N-acetyltransferase [Bacillota bacterium]